MRLLEIILFGTVLSFLIIQYIPSLRKGSLLRYTAIIAVVVIPLHLVIDGYRWQMVPIYVFSLGIFLFGLIKTNLHLENQPVIRNKILRIIGRTITVILFLFCLIFPALLPVVDLPEPTGPFSVGITSYRMTDYQCKEIFTKDPDDSRSLLVTVWYPAQIINKSKRCTYWDKHRITGKAYSNNADIGNFWYTHLSLVKTNSYENQPVSTARGNFPVLIYSHSFYGMNAEYTMLLEELASHGYIVFSISHTYENIVSIFPDQEIITGDLTYISEQFDSHPEEERQLYEKYGDAAGMEEKTELVRKILQVDDLSTELLKIRKGDVLFLLDQMEQLYNSEGFFEGKLDVSQIGILGWSFGGATALEACIADHRIKAGVNLDGTPYGELFNTGQKISQPLMLIRSDSEDEMEDIIGHMIAETTVNESYAYIIRDASHTNFWDFPLFFRVYKYFGYWDSIDPLRLLEINSQYIRAFFDQHLLGVETGLLKEPSSMFPEVEYIFK
jgi:dienelactone hydrolase